MTRFVKGATTLQFNQDPVRPYTVAATLRQLLERDSGGSDYVYQKSTLRRDRHRLLFPRLSDAVYAALWSFVANDIDGIRHPFTWYDHDDTARSVRLASSELRADNIGPDQWRVELELTEDVTA